MTAQSFPGFGLLASMPSEGGLRSFTVESREVYGWCGFSGFMFRGLGFRD